MSRESFYKRWNLMLCRLEQWHQYARHWLCLRRRILGTVEMTPLNMGVFVIVPWLRHQMETFSALLALCAGNSPVTGEFPSQRPVTRSFDVFFDLRLNKRLSKQSWGWWFETPSRPLWRHCNGSYDIKRDQQWASEYRLPTKRFGAVTVVIIRETCCRVIYQSPFNNKSYLVISRGIPFLYRYLWTVYSICHLSTVLLLHFSITHARRQ